MNLNTLKLDLTNTKNEFYSLAQSICGNNPDAPVTCGQLQDLTEAISCAMEAANERICAYLQSTSR